MQKLCQKKTSRKDNFMVSSFSAFIIINESTQCVYFIFVILKSFIPWASYHHQVINHRNKWKKNFYRKICRYLPFIFIVSNFTWRKEWWLNLLMNIWERNCKGNENILFINDEPKGMMNNWRKITKPFDFNSENVVFFIFLFLFSFSFLIQWVY